MPIYRPRKLSKNFTVLPNALLRGGIDKQADNLDLQSLGLLCYLLSHHQDWTITNSQLSNHWQVSKNTITRITKKLEARGYLIKQNSFVKDNGWNWLVTDTPFNFGDPKSCDPKSCDPKNREVRRNNSNTVSETTSNTVSKTSKKTITGVSFDDACIQCPAGCPPKVFERWLRTKTKTNWVGVKKLQNAVKDFQELKRAGLTSWDEAIDKAIDRGWQSVKPEYFEYLIKQNKTAEKTFEGVA